MSDTLKRLAAQAVPGYANEDACKFARTSDPEYLDNMHMLAEMESKINTVGRIPPIPDHMDVPGWPHVKVKVQEGDAYCSQMRFERMTGKLRAHTRFSHVTEEGAVFRTDCLAVPELWWETTLTQEELEEALSALGEQ